MKERSLQIVDGSGNQVALLDGDTGIFLGDNTRKLVDVLSITWPLLAASVDSFIWTPFEGVWKVVSVRSAITVSGGTSAAVGVMVCPGGVAIASGTAQLDAALDLEETAPDTNVGTLIASPTNIFPGDWLGLDFSGTLTNLVGAITIWLKRTQ